MVTIKIEKELKIKNVGKLWKNIKDSDGVQKFDCTNLEKYDCAGFQFLLYIMKLNRDKPKTYKLKGLNDDLLTSITSNGYTMEQGEDNK